jgi:hypothetical protein
MKNIIAVGGKGQVIRCTCGQNAIHIQYGRCTLTLSEAEFVDFSLMIEDAAAQLHPLKPLMNNLPKNGGR